MSTSHHLLSWYIAEILRGVIAERRLTKQEVGRAIGMKQQTWSRRMTGETPLTVDELVDVCAYLSLDLEGLVNDAAARRLRAAEARAVAVLSPEDMAEIASREAELNGGETGSSTTA